MDTLLMLQMGDAVFAATAEIEIYTPDRVMRVRLKLIAWQILASSAHPPDNGAIVAKRVLLDVAIIVGVDGTPEHEFLAAADPA
jgi:hypothetical protein